MRFAPFALPPAAFEARRQRLTWDFHKWDTHVSGRETVARGALMLSSREHAELVAASEALFELTETAMARFVADPEATRALGVDPALVPLARGPTRARITRIDWFLTAQGWMASEWNDDAPGGFNDALGLAALFHDAVEKGAEIPGDLPLALLRLVAPPGVERVGFCYATGYSEDLQVVRLLADLVETEGVETVLASPAHLAHEAGRTTLAGEEIGSVHRFFPAEWFPVLPNLDAWRDAVAAGVRVVNPLDCAWSQSKASFALLDQNERLPATRLFTRELVAEATSDRERFVLKPAFGRMGEGVVLGATSTRDDWRKSLEGALRSTVPYVLQERFHPIPLELAPGVTGTVCVGAYVVDGRFAGYYSRLARGRVVRHDASNLLTLLEAV